MKHFTIALDGPCAAGKGTIAKLVSERIGCNNLDTGATFRAVALKVIREGFSTKNKDEVLKVLENIDIKVQFNNEGQVTYLDGENVNDKIRTPEVSRGSSDVSAIPQVRLEMVEIWRDIAKQDDIVMEGRDIGTFVFPNADVKIYLTACVEKRAERRYKEMIEKGYNVVFEDIKKSIEERDYQDINRDFAPLTKAEDAIEIDTSELRIDQVADKIIEIVDHIRNK